MHPLHFSCNWGRLKEIVCTSLSFGWAGEDADIVKLQVHEWTEAITAKMSLHSEKIAVICLALEEETNNNNDDE
jgi:hypothetical protein